MEGTDWRKEYVRLSGDNEKLCAEVERWKGALSDSMTEKKAADLQVSVLQKRLEAIGKVASKPSSLFPKSMAEMTEVEGKIAIVACELSGDLSYIKGLAESPITEKRNRVCGFWTAGRPCVEREPCPKHGTMPTNRI